ncbi:hypothetical protein [Peribacillus frigoritolerans]|nr:hypothetical protein [Peribacillus frigoritolerans]MDM5313837.1 hypothetical protein [Peribacillus frigoritolerans]
MFDLIWIVVAILFDLYFNNWARLWNKNTTARLLDLLHKRIL